jgi:hypothetical protein
MQEHLYQNEVEISTRSAYDNFQFLESLNDFPTTIIGSNPKLYRPKETWNSPRKHQRETLGKINLITPMFPPIRHEVPVSWAFDD